VPMHCAGILLAAVLLGVLVTRASIPSARVVFSDVCLLTSRNGEPMLIIRIGNTRGNFLLNPEIRVGYLRVRRSNLINRQYTQVV
jgi:inward rectifier potassium channel